jgi:mRNA-degrading endonuclease toxin of MazEF toxin-antitoxin module
MRFPHAIRVLPSPINGLAVETFFMAHQLRVIDNRLLRAQPGMLDAADLAKLDAALAAMLGLVVV